MRTKRDMKLHNTTKYHIFSASAAAPLHEKCLSILKHENTRRGEKRMWGWRNKRSVSNVIKMHPDRWKLVVQPHIMNSVSRKEYINMFSWQWLHKIFCCAFKNWKVIVTLIHSLAEVVVSTMRSASACFICDKIYWLTEQKSKLWKFKI